MRAAHTFEQTSRASERELLSPNVGVIVVTHNSTNFLPELLESLYDSDCQSFRLVVIDSGSARSELKRLQIIQRRYLFELQILPANVGYAAAVNVGLHFLRSRDVDYAWVLNPDMRVEPLALTELLRFHQAGVGHRILGSKVLWEDKLSGDQSQNEVKIWGLGGLIDREALQVSMLGHGALDGSQFQQEVDVDYVPGCAMFFSMKDLDVLGYLPEDYFLYFEETHWCAAAKENGAKLIVVPKSRVWHRFHESKLQMPRTIYYYNRNERRFWWSRLTGGRRLKFLFRTLLVDLLRAQRAILQTNDSSLLKRLRAQRLAYIHFLLGRSGRL